MSQLFHVGTHVTINLEGSFCSRVLAKTFHCYLLVHCGTELNCFYKFNGLPLEQGYCLSWGSYVPSNLHTFS
jgi:hypothetical protein